MLAEVRATTFTTGPELDFQTIDDVLETDPIGRRGERSLPSLFAGHGEQSLRASACGRWSIATRTGSPLAVAFAKFDLVKAPGRQARWTTPIDELFEEHAQLELCEVGSKSRLAAAAPGVR